jgi:hypothetical protein
MSPFMQAHVHWLKSMKKNHTKIPKVWKFEPMGYKAKYLLKKSFD